MRRHHLATKRDAVNFAARSMRSSFVDILAADDALSDPESHRDPQARNRRVAGCPWVCHAVDLAPHRPPGLVGLFLEETLLPNLRATLVIDYQNIHLTGVWLFEPNQPAHLHLVHPLHFANQVVARRHQNQQAGYASAVVTKVLVHRGLPSAEISPRAYARNLAQKAAWELDPG